jgi:hypothetical protein
MFVLSFRSYKKHLFPVHGNDRCGINSETTLSTTGSEVPCAPLSGNMTISICVPFFKEMTINMFKTICSCLKKDVSLDPSLHHLSKFY